MQIYFSSRDKARSFKASCKNPANKQVKDNGKEAAKRWSVVIAKPVK